MPTEGPCPNPHTLPPSDVVEATVRLLSVLAHPGRLTVVLALSETPGLTAGELQRLAGLEQSAMSHQLRILREQRLVVAERDGRHVRYRNHDHHVAHIVADAVSHAREGLDG